MSGEGQIVEATDQEKQKKEATAGAAVASSFEAKTIAALYVERNGVYANLPGVEVWDEERDARLYDGPWPVVAHPPCARWCALAGFVEYVYGYKRGEDGGCFAAALHAVRTYGGVIEHPANSQAWSRYELPKPLWKGGWSLALDGGASCYVEQGHYGHRGAKPTWLYAFGVDLPELRWGDWTDADGGRGAAWWITPGSRRDASRRLRRENSSGTPLAFRDTLLAIARTAHALRVAA